MKADRRDFDTLAQAVKHAHRRAASGTYAPLVVEDLAEALIAILAQHNSSFRPERFRLAAGLTPKE